MSGFKQDGDYHEYNPQWRERMKDKIASLMRDLRASPEPCTPRTCTRKPGQACERISRKDCRSVDRS
jgi:hypothetical protein